MVSTLVFRALCCLTRWVETTFTRLSAQFSFLDEVLLEPVSGCGVQMAFLDVVVFNESHSVQAHRIHHAAGSHRVVLEHCHEEFIDLLRF